MPSSGAVVVAQALAVAAFVALALALWIFLRRAARVLAETRQTEAFRRSTADLAARIELSLDGVTARIDAVRRRTVAANTIADNVAAARDAVERYAEEAASLVGPAGSRPIREAIVAELERAGRALEMAAHGCELLSQARPSHSEVEAETSIKRGYLNLLHAREAIHEHAARAAQLGTGDTPRLFERRNA